MLNSIEKAIVYIAIAKNKSIEDVKAACEFYVDHGMDISVKKVVDIFGLHLDEIETKKSDRAAELYQTQENFRRCIKRQTLK